MALYILTVFWLLVVLPLAAAAAPYAAMVIDARTGEVLHSENADTRLHPASLTKMMTLYIAFEAVENGEISLDTLVRVSKNAAAEPPSKLGLRAGQRIKLRYLIRAAAIKSANDAATAIGEAIEGSEAAFARRMNRTAQALGMTRTTFKNAHGLTENGHLSTARDMTTLGRHLFYDYPEYYNLFSRITADAGVAEVAHTNRRLLQSYKGADGIKTGYTRAAGFNLTASAERGNERIIATVFGGRSTATRNAKVAELLDLGFARAPSRVALRKPSKPPYMGKAGNAPQVISVAKADVPGAQGKSVRLLKAAAVTESLRPKARPTPEAPQPEPQLVAVVDVDQADIMAAIQAAQAAPVEPPEPASEQVVQVAAITPDVTPKARPSAITQPRSSQTAEAEAVREVVTRVSTSGGRHWGINVGRYTSRYKAEKVLLTTALSEMSTLDGALRKVVQSPRGFDANFMGMTRDTAELACRRLQAKQVQCFMVGPG